MVCAQITYFFQSWVIGELPFSQSSLPKRLGYQVDGSNPALKSLVLFRLLTSMQSSKEKSSLRILTGLQLNHLQKHKKFWRTRSEMRWWMLVKFNSIRLWFWDLKRMQGGFVWATRCMICSCNHDHKDPWTCVVVFSDYSKKIIHMYFGKFPP